MSISEFTLVGCGIKFISHLTLETKAYIKGCDKVLYLVNDPLMAEWLKENSRNSESLDKLYSSKSPRLESYRVISEYILKSLNRVKYLCFVLYGHPTVFAQPGLDAAIEAKNLGYVVRILPSVSAESCLYADLFIDPGEYGCQSFEATDFLIRPRLWDKTSHLILWQVASIGMLGVNNNHNNIRGTELLVNKLQRQYALTHKIIIYEAAQYPTFKPRVETIELKNLPYIKLNSTSTMYVPPVSKAMLDHQILNKLNIKLDDLNYKDSKNY